MCVISQRHRVTFIHIPKNAGGSIRSAMVQHGGFKPPKLFQHVPARVVQEYNNHQFKDYFSFAVVRNPWDRVWSMYKFALGRKGQGHPDVGNSFDEYLFNGKATHGWASHFTDPETPPQRRPQTDWLLDDRLNVIVDCIIRYESLNQGLEVVYERSNLPPLSLNRTHNTSHKLHYTEAFSQEGIKFVEEHFAKDIEMFNYKFGD